MPSSLDSVQKDVYSDTLEGDASVQDVHFDNLVSGRPSAPYPPPSYIDSASRDLLPPFPPTRPPSLSFGCSWLGAAHDGYPLAATLDEYYEIRQTGRALSALDRVALIQSQMTFGFLEAVLRMKIPEVFLISTREDGTSILSTANLPILARDWYHRSRIPHSPDQCRSWLNEVRTILSEASQLRFALFFNPDESDTPFRIAGLSKEASKIGQVVGMIGHSLQLALMGFSQECSPAVDSLLFAFNYPPLPEQTRTRLRAQGWCPFTIVLLESCRLTALEYASSFSPFLRYPGEHDGCTNTGCRANNIVRSTYTRKHSSVGCDCSYTIPPIHLVVSLLSDGRIPTVSIRDEGLTVQAAEDQPYVAISHVWVDGLGSTTEEGLPSCQVTRIASMASSLVPGGAFWMDGLCIPGHSDLRKRAIQLMAKTYADAAVVLVIDAGIRTCSKDAPMEEKLLRIVTSGWMQRLWTFQEAMLAKRLCFEFRDGLVDLKDLIPSREGHFVCPLLADLSEALCEIHLYGPGHRTKEPLSIDRAANALRWRTTNRVGDETLAIAGLLQVDVRQFLDTPSPDERMKSLLLQKGKVHPNVVFTLAPKISGIPGFSWAPRSLMSGTSLRAAWVGDESALCTPTGLLADYATHSLSALVELDEAQNYLIHNATQPTCSFLMIGVASVRGEKRKICDAFLVQPQPATTPGSRSMCVGVKMVETEEGTSGEKVQVCQYQDIFFISVSDIEASTISRLEASGISVIHDECCTESRMKIRLV